MKRTLKPKVLETFRNEALIPGIKFRNVSKRIKNVAFRNEVVQNAMKRFSKSELI